jgi:sigma-B regulation protein RsbU (phosphoserine phosphatase)
MKGRSPIQGRAKEYLSAPQADRDWVLGIVSHELRNPLAAITMLSMVLMEGSAASAAAQHASRILASARRMNEIIGGLLDLSQARWGGGLAIKPTSIDAHEICRRIVGELEAPHPGRQIRLLLEGDANGFWDGDRLEQVVCNLVSNALQHGAEDSPITVESRGGETHWQLAVHNLGMPIPPVMMPRLYDPFARGPGARQEGAGHLGIGLFIVRQLVLGHGGTIQATSSASEGTRFVVRLPRAVARLPRAVSR